MYMDVDAAVTVPVNLFPLLDDTDFKTREAAVTYNQAGLDLIWNFVTTAGAQTHTAVTPTDTGGNYDWVNIGHGMYNIEIPASGGASINNDTEGFGWFTGFATGVLPWRGPVICFRAAGLNNVMVDSAYSATRGLSGTALPDAAADAAGGLPISDAGGLPMDKIGYLPDAAPLDEAGLRTAMGLVSANLNTLLTTIDTVVDSVKAVTDAIGTKLTAHVAAVLMVVVGTGSDTTHVVLSTVDGAAPSATNDFYNGRTLIFTSGAMAGQAASITDYVGSTVTATISAVTGSAANGVTAVIV
jgi:hypothetical protein